MPPKHDYFGIEVPWDMLIPSMRRLGVYGFLYDMTNMTSLIDRLDGQAALRALSRQTSKAG